MLVYSLAYLCPEDGGDIFLRNIGRLSPGYTALYPKRQNSSMLKKVAVHKSGKIIS
jgi:hypothetical protein